MDESIYVILRVQVIPDIEYMKNKDEFIRCVNEMNINYKAVKYYLGADNALYLDMYIPNLPRFKKFTSIIFILLILSIFSLLSLIGIL